MNKFAQELFFERCKVVVLGAGMLAGWVGELMVVAHSEQASALHVARPQLVQLPGHFSASLKGFVVSF